MPVSTTWHDADQTILRLDFHPEWTVAELSDAIVAAHRMITGVKHIVDVIWDTSNARAIPSNLITHFSFPTEDSLVPANQGAVVVVVRHAYMRTFVSVAKRSLFQLTQNMHMVDTLEQAAQKVAALRAEQIPT